MYVIATDGMRLVTVTPSYDDGFAIRVFDVKPEDDPQAVEISEGVFGHHSKDQLIAFKPSWFEAAFEQPDALNRIRKVNNRKENWERINQGLIGELYRYGRSGKEKALVDAFKQRNRLRMML